MQTGFVNSQLPILASQPNMTDLSPTELLWLAVVVFIAVGVVTRTAPHERKYLRASVAIFALSFLCRPAAALVTPFAPSGVVNGLLLTGTVLFRISLINLGSLFLFDAVLPLLRLELPRIVRDLAVLGAYGVVLVFLLASFGVQLTSIIATSAVVTAVIGLSLQDTLGNLMAGLALQLEQVIQVGDWVKIDQYNGRVKQIRWRQTSIETRNWDTVVIPNSQILKSQVTVFGRRENAPFQSRRWVYFNVDFRYSPTDVIECVNQALQSAPIQNVAREPLPHAIFMEFKESYGVYAVRYWLTDLAADDPTDSVVRTRVYFALKRGDIPLSIPAHSVFITEETQKRRARKEERETEHRLGALRKVELFGTLTGPELRALTEHMKFAPFSRGEVLTRQGAEGHWLYIITEGQVSVTVSVKDKETGQSFEKEVRKLGEGDVFGEMSLMTGEPRAATIVALTDVECFRLDKEAFQDLLAARPEIAEDFSHILAKRRLELDAVREGLDKEAQTIRMHATQNQILGLIRDFFGL